MRVTKEKAAEHRAAIVKAASRLFRERGFENVGVAEITKAAGLTHGGFYGHFDSKDALVAEACGRAFADSLARMRGDDSAAPLLAFVNRYLSDRHVTGRDGGCPMAALAGEIPRREAAVERPFADGVGQYIDALAELLPSEEGRQGKRERRKHAILLLAALVGGLSLARATTRTAPDISDEILSALRSGLAQSL